MPFCRECGNEIDGAMKFCPHCAAPQDVSPSTQSTNVSHDTVIEDDVLGNKIESALDETATSMVSEAANTSITQSTNAPEEADEVELDPEDTEAIQLLAEIAYLQNLMENEDSRIRNYARWGLNELTNPDILKSKRHKSLTGKITTVASLVFIIALVAVIISNAEVLVPILCMSSATAALGFILWFTWRTNTISVIIDNVERCSYCNMIIPKDGWFKGAFADKTPIKRHWHETNHLRELATTAAEMSGEEMGWWMKAKLNFIEND